MELSQTTNNLMLVGSVFTRASRSELTRRVNSLLKARLASFSYWLTETEDGNRVLQAKEKMPNMEYRTAKSKKSQV